MRRDIEGGRPLAARRGIGVTRNHVFAIVFACLAVVTGTYAVATMEIGTPAQMGPGFFPLMLSVALAILSTLVGIVKPAQAPEPLVYVSIRGFVPVILAPVFFGLAVAPLGLLPAVFLTVALASSASRFARLKTSLLLAGGFSVFCVVVFHYLLRLPIPVFGPVFGS